MIDLTGQTQLVYVFDFDDPNGFVTVKIFDSTESTLFGEIKLDQGRMRAFVESLGLFGKVYFDDLQNVQRFRTSHNKNINKATVIFG